MRRHSKVIAGLGLASVLALTACGGGNDSASDNGGNEGERTTIRIATWDSGSGLEILEQIADSFMETHEDIEIVIESVPDGLGDRLLTQIAASDAPDIFQLGDGDVAMFAERGGIQDLTPFIEGENGLNLDDFYMPVIEGAKVDDSLFGLIKDFSTLAVYYNKDMFDAAGIPYPTDDWTWEEFREIAKQLTIEEDGNVTQWGAMGMSGGVRDIGSLIRSFGGSLISEDGTTVEGYMNSQETIAALEFNQEMRNLDGSMPSATDVTAAQGVDLFLSERVAMSINGTWPGQSYVDAGMNFGTVMLPQGPAGHAGTIFFAAYTMWSGTENPDEAWEFIKYLMTEGQEKMVAHGLTANNVVAENVGLTDPDHHMAGFVRSIEIIEPLFEFINPNFNAAVGREFESVNERISLAVDEAIDLRSALDEAAELAQTELDHLAEE